MLSLAAIRSRKSTGKLASFTLIELLVVMAIIAILASLILYAGNAVIIKGERSRASAEVQAMSTALESYKTDNGIYPYDGNLAGTNAYQTTDCSASGGGYQLSSGDLYTNLSGQSSFSATALVSKAYMSFKAGQIANPSASTYIQDPFGHSYGYCTATNSSGVSIIYNGSGFFDLWSTGGLKGTTDTNTGAWLSNWQ